MAKTNFILLNGWACDASHLTELASEYGTVVSNKDYFNKADANENLPNFSNLDSKNTVLIGYSLGGFTALKALTKQNFKACILISSFSDFVTGLLGNARVNRIRTAQLDAMIEQCQKNPKELSESFFKNVYSPASPKIIEQDSYNTESLVSGLQELKESIGVEKIETPCLILHGAKDKVVPVAFSKQLHQTLKNSHLELFETCGHALPMLHSAEIIKHIDLFLKEID